MRKNEYLRKRHEEDTKNVLLSLLIVRKSLGCVKKCVITESYKKRYYRSVQHAAQYVLKGLQYVHFPSEPSFGEDPLDAEEPI